MVHDPQIGPLQGGLALSAVGNRVLPVTRLNARDQQIPGLPSQL